MSRLIRFFNIISFTALMICLVSSCSKEAPKAKPDIPVNAITVQQEDIPIFIETVGHFTAYNHVNIQAQVEGQLLNYYFQEGQEVHEGDLLFTIDPRPYEAALAEAIATLKQNEANLKFAQDRLYRYTPLVQEDFVSQLDYDQYTSEVQYYSALVEENKAQIFKAEVDLGYCTIYSPITGITGKRLIDNGNLITNAGTSLLVINQVSPLYVDFSIPERYFDKVIQRQRESQLTVDITIPNTDLKTTASLEMINNMVNENTGMIAMRGILSNTEKLFWPGQFIRVRLVLYIQKNACVVPTSALSIGQEGQYVWKINKDHTVQPEYVEVKERFDGKAIIQDGIKSGDLLVTQGQLNLRPGVKVKVVEVNGKKEKNSKS